MIRATLALASALAFGAVGAEAQRPATALAPDTILVGDVFRAAIRLDLPAGARARVPDSLTLGPDLEHAGHVRQSMEALPGGGQRITFSYPFTAWRPGPLPLPNVPVTITERAGTRVLEASLPPLVVRSVLPPDTAGIEPKPLKDVMGRSWLLWPLLLALALLLLAAAALGYWWYRRRRRAEPAPALFETTPRERALAALDHARGLGLLEAGELKAFYSLVTQAVRQYLEALDPSWGEDLTTSELTARLRADRQERAAAELSRLLYNADLVKFARRRVTHDEALGDWRAAHAFVEAFTIAEPIPEAA